MKNIVLSNGMEMPMLGFGVFRIEDSNVCEMAVETGYRLIDTAMTYNNEESVGRAVQNSCVRREDFFFTTKVWISDAGYDRTLKAFDLSLKKLEPDYLDLYLVHMPFGDYYGSCRAMEKHHQEGSIRSRRMQLFSVTVD